MLKTQLTRNRSATSCTANLNFATIMKPANTEKICRRAPCMKVSA